jgi:flagellar protein FliO/FliZ
VSFWSTLRAGRSAAFALAMGVSRLAVAQAEPTPLQLRHDSPSVSSPSDAPIGAGWKLGGLAAVVAGVAVWMRRRRAAQPSKAVSEVRVVARTAISGRSELLVVDVGGQHVLLGVTPTSIRHLVDLELDRAEPVEQPRVIEAPPANDVRTRFDALIDRAQTALPIEAQAKNLLVLKRRL